MIGLLIAALIIGIFSGTRAGRDERGGSVHLNSSARLLSEASAGFMWLREALG
jgi:hypothetical protein